MKKTDVIRTLKKGECVTSIYAQTYLTDDHCDYKRPETPEQDEETSQPVYDEWVSPSDLLIGILDLTPPFTSKITRGTTHQGILNIGDAILNREQAHFIKLMNGKIKENDAAWYYILEHEKSATAKKVKAIYNEILKNKSKTLIKEINIFFEQNLQELEDHIRSEVQNVMITAHANIVSDLNFEIKENLKREKIILEDVLQKRYVSEVNKIKHYYKLILDNEIHKNNKLINNAINERNYTLKLFYKQIEAQNITSTMYVMSTERKKCRIRKFILESIQNTEIAEKLQKIKERQEILDAFKARYRELSDINTVWEHKIKKILQMFIKFIGFSLRLLPEQTIFLLDLEKMVVLQLNEMQKRPLQNISILVDQDDENVLQFEEPEPKENVCDKEPFVIVGDLSDPVPPKYGSRETLASDVDLPYMRLQRKFIYAKCGRMDEVREFLESQRCKCHDQPPKPSTPSTSTESIITPETEATEVKSESSFEPLLMDDIQRLKDCPVRHCQDWVSKYAFPCLDSYLDFTEEKYQNIKSILGEQSKIDAVPDLIDPMTMLNQELPFAATKETHRTVGTQYSIPEDISVDFRCPCIGNQYAKPKKPQSAHELKKSESNEIREISKRRQASLRRILQEHPNLMKLFTDENFDFTYTIKI